MVAGLALDTWSVPGPLLLSSYFTSELVSSSVAGEEAFPWAMDIDVMLLSCLAYNKCSVKTPASNIHEQCSTGYMVGSWEMLVYNLLDFAQLLQNNF